MSKEALSLDISRLVSRVVRGETIDIAERGAALAEQYPDLGMTGAMIGQAIERAAGMVGMIRNAPIPPKPPRAAPPPIKTAEVPLVHAEPARVQPPHAPRPALPAAPPGAALSIDDELAAAIDAEIGNLVSGHAAATSPQARSKGETRTAQAAAMASNDASASRSPSSHGRAYVETPQPQPPAAASRQVSAHREPPHGSIFSSFRRALFRT